MNGRTRNPGTLPPASRLRPGESKTYGLKFLVSDSIRHIENTLARQSAAGRRWRAGLRAAPGHRGHDLFLRYGKPVTSLKVEPRIGDRDS